MRYVQWVEYYVQFLTIPPVWFFVNVSSFDRTFSCVLTDNLNYVMKYPVKACMKDFNMLLKTMWKFKDEKYNTLTSAHKM